MPKRRMTPKRKAQIAKWQAAGAKAKKAKAKARKGKSRNEYSGKITVYHRTSHEAANSILRNGFSTANRRTGQKAEAFFSTKLYSGLTRLYGPAVITAKLSPSTIRRHGWSYQPSFSSGKWHSLPVGYLSGTKLRRVLVTQSERKPKMGKRLR